MHFSILSDESIDTTKTEHSSRRHLDEWAHNRPHPREALVNASMQQLWLLRLLRLLPVLGAVKDMSPQIQILERLDIMNCKRKRLDSSDSFLQTLTS